MAYNTFQIRVIDPSTTSKNRAKIKEGEEIQYSIIEEFYDHGWDFEPGINDVNSGITRMREYMQIDSEGETKLYIFKDKCPNLCLEMQNWRYREYSDHLQRQKNDSEEPVKKNDHAVDALRYIIQTRPYANKSR